MRVSTSLSVLLAFSAGFTGCSGEHLAFDSSNGVSARAETLFRAQQAQDGRQANEVVAYWGHTPGNRNASILDLCQESQLDTVIVGWIVDFSHPGGFPRFDFGAGCSNMTPGKAAMNSSCGDRSKEISSCQGLGKKVFIGIGGASSSITFTSRQDAVDAADKLWSLFGNTTSTQVYQPFQNVSIDGFDLDHENGSPDYFDVFAQSLRQSFARNPRQISLSTCVSCAFTDPVPDSLYQEVDFVSVRFYNAKSCNWGSKGFNASLKKWCSTLSGKNVFFKLRVALLAFNSGGSGYIPPDGMVALMADAVATTGACIGGVTFWDGTMAMQTTTQHGDTFFDVVSNVKLGHKPDSGTARSVVAPLNYLHKVVQLCIVAIIIEFF